MSVSGGPPGSVVPAPKRTRRRWVIVGAVAAIVVVVLALIEILARVIVGQVAANELTTALPPEVSASVSATPTGACVSCELILGRLSGLDISSSDISIGGATGAVDAQVAGVRLASPNTVDDLSGTVRIGQADLNALVGQLAAAHGFPVGDIALHAGEVQYTSTLQLLGASLDVSVTARVSVMPGGWVQFTATRLQAMAGELDISAAEPADRFSFRFCAAEALPEVLRIESVAVDEGALALGFRSTGPFTPDSATLSRTGACHS